MVWLLAAMSCALACTFDSGAAGASAGLGDTADDTGDATDTTRPMDSGVEDDSNDASTASDGLTSGPPMACGDGGVCAPEVPGGWTGPIVVARWGGSETPVVCPQDWPMVASRGIDLAGLPATCGCNCTPTVGACQVDYEYFEGDGCFVSVASGSTSGACSNHWTGLNPDTLEASVSQIGSSCAANPVVTTPEPVWSQTVLACQPGALGTCDDGRPCMPEVPTEFDERYCIMAPGDNACPAGPYAARSLAYSAVEDTRGCSPCECTLAATCTGALHEYHDNECTNPAGSVAVTGSCQASTLPGSDGGAFSVAWVGGPPSVTCTPTVPTATGSVTPSEAMTFCCTP
jgi:hypothetical protein